MQLTLELKKAIENNAFCSIATYLENNEIQNHLMWIDYKDDFLLINTEKGRKKTTATSCRSCNPLKPSTKIPALTAIEGTR